MENTSTPDSLHVSASFREFRKLVTGNGCGHVVLFHMYMVEISFLFVEYRRWLAFCLSVSC